MLVYDKLFDKLKEKGVNKSALRNYGFAPRVSVKLSRGEDVSIDTINRLCQLLDCQPSDIMEYIPDVETQEMIIENIKDRK
jgi:DNA-binding Xre family transcriptional regulator